MRCLLIEAGSWDGIEIKEYSSFHEAQEEMLRRFYDLIEDEPRDLKLEYYNVSSFEELKEAFEDDGHLYGSDAILEYDHGEVAFGDGGYGQNWHWWEIYEIDE